MRVRIILLLFLAGCTSQVCNESSQVYFCPEDKCSAHLIEVFDGANDSIHCAIYSFTLDSVAQSLARANDRSVEVKVIFEKQQAASNYSRDEWLESNGVGVHRDTNPGYMHNKFCIIDGKIVVTGSFNWSENADEQNDENLLIILSQALAQLYDAEFWEIWTAGSE
jgi:phosphatidylserine/phosphatidylglycerophosphate/cardiolipin synthase-like enzyme